MVCLRSRFAGESTFQFTRIMSKRGRAKLPRRASRSPRSQYIGPQPLLDLLNRAASQLQEMRKEAIADTYDDMLDTVMRRPGFRNSIILEAEIATVLTHINRPF